MGVGNGFYWALEGACSPSGREGEMGLRGSSLFQPSQERIQIFLVIFFKGSACPPNFWDSSLILPVQNSGSWLLASPFDCVEFS